MYSFETQLNELSEIAVRAYWMDLYMDDMYDDDPFYDYRQFALNRISEKLSAKIGDVTRDTDCYLDFTYEVTDYEVICRVTAFFPSKSNVTVTSSLYNPNQR